MKIKHLVLTVALAAASSAYAATDVTVTSDQQGWFTPTGDTGGSFQGNNAYAGFGGTTFASFAGFDFSSLNGQTLTSAAISMGSATIGSLSDSFNITEVNGATSYSSITGGTVIGTGTTTNGVLTINLNSAGVTFINANDQASSGETFLGFIDTSAANSSQQRGFFNNLTSNTGSYTAYTPNVTVTAVPEPENYSMILAGLGLLGFMVSRKKSV